MTDLNYEISSSNKNGKATKTKLTQHNIMVTVLKFMPLKILIKNSPMIFFTPVAVPSEADSIEFCIGA